MLLPQIGHTSRDDNFASECLKPNFQKTYFQTKSLFNAPSSNSPHETSLIHLHISIDQTKTIYISKHTRKRNDDNFVSECLKSNFQKPCTSKENPCATLPPEIGHTSAASCISAWPSIRIKTRCKYPIHKHKLSHQA